MRPILKIALLILVTIALTACATKERCNNLYPCQGMVITSESTSSTTEITDERHDSIVYISDSAAYKLLLKCDSAGNVMLCEIETLRASQNIKPSFSLSDNKLTVGCKIDSAAVAIAWNEKHIKTTIAHTSATKETIPVEVNKITFWHRAGQILSALFIIELLILIYLLWKRK
ncbi:MAG TPA: hypothetical protein PLC48_08935 [Ferruginibacter sp.]|nr:hypothetical protein [Ferruginibacter sp.]